VPNKGDKAQWLKKQSDLSFLMILWVGWQGWFLAWFYIGSFCSSGWWPRQKFQSGLSLCLSFGPGCPLEHLSSFPCDCFSSIGLCCFPYLVVCIPKEWRWAGTVICTCSPSYLGGWGRKVTWIQELGISLGDIGRSCLIKTKPKPRRKWRWQRQASWCLCHIVPPSLPPSVGQSKFQAT
jgi:hypothetical protein